MFYICIHKYPHHQLVKQNKPSEKQSYCVPSCIICSYGYNKLFKQPLGLISSQERICWRFLKKTWQYFFPWSFQHKHISSTRFVALGLAYCCWHCCSKWGWGDPDTAHKLHHWENYFQPAINRQLWKATDCPPQDNGGAKRPRL